MSTSDRQWVFLQDVSKLINKAVELGIKLTAGETYRTEEQQQLYVDKGLSKTLDSQHRKRLAIDFNFFTTDGSLSYDKQYVQPLGDYWESLRDGNEWGGNWDSFLDVPHFQAK